MARCQRRARARACLAHAEVRALGGGGTDGAPLARPKRGSFTALCRETPSPCYDQFDFFFAGGGGGGGYMVTRCLERAGASQPPATPRVGSWERGTPTPPHVLPHAEISPEWTAWLGGKEQHTHTQSPQDPHPRARRGREGCGQ